MSLICAKAREVREGYTNQAKEWPREELEEFVSKSFVTVHSDLPICSDEELPAFYNEIVDTVLSEGHIKAAEIADQFQPTLRELKRALDESGSKIESVFGAMDCDGNGVLDLKEVRLLMVKMGLPPACHSLQFAKDLFNEVDKDNSGRINFIELAQSLEAVNTETGFRDSSTKLADPRRLQQEQRKAAENAARASFEAISMDHEPIFMDQEVEPME